MNNETPSSDANSQEKKPQGKKILVVDDNPMVANMVVRSLRRLGHTDVRVASSGKEALELAANIHFNLVIVDISMPVMDGIQTARSIHEIYPCSIIFSTGLWDDKTLERSREVQASAYLVKPFSPAQLQAALQLAN
jgi:two-component system, response regulator PdtaR